MFGMVFDPNFLTLLEKRGVQFLLVIAHLAQLHAMILICKLLGYLLGLVKGFRNAYVSLQAAQNKGFQNHLKSFDVLILVRYFPPLGLSVFVLTLDELAKDILKVFYLNL